MNFEPKDVYQKLEFDKVVELLRRECLTEMAVEQVENLQQSTDFQWIDKALRETAEFKLTLEKNDRFPIASFSDIEPAMKMLDIDGYTLDAGAFQQIVQILYLTRDVFKYFGGQKKEIYPHLFDIVRPLSFDEGLIKAINAVFTEKGEIRPDASPELQQIRRQIDQKHRELDHRFRQLVQEYRSKNWLSENPESIRNSRRVLSVPAEHKRKIKGIIHDESDSGRTVFIEPDAVVEINNDIFDLQMDERREIFRILKNLSDTIRPYSPTLRGYLSMLVRFDLISAKARLAVAMKASMPILKEKPILNFRKAFHPLLFLKNKNLGRKTVPFDLRLTAENHILVLSGPNAGGKSVAMKSVGLLQLMLQSGLLVPVHELSEVGIFHQIFADIGDQQSLDDDLSTYSSRLQNARVFLEKATPQTLVLVDEMGSGTDPKPGGAIAEAILQQLHRRGVFAVVTTHYSNLKVFAFRNTGILNGNMHFDKDTLSPTYELKVGRPGSSYAFEIATKSGLPKHLIDFARKKTGPETAVDDILIELQAEKQQLEEKLRSVAANEQNLDRLIKSYDSMHSDLEMKRKRLKLEQKEFELRQQSNTQRELEALIKTLKQEKNVERARAVADEIKASRASMVSAVDEIHADIQKIEQAAPDLSAKIEVGSSVRLRAGGATGIVSEISGKKAFVQMGDLKISVAVRDLLPAAAPAKIATPNHQADIERASSFESKLDIRGMMKDEALLVLEKFLDNALLSDVSTVRITHGKGTGVLRQVVRQKLREYGGSVGSSYHPAPEQGGDGVTVVDLV